jgi:uncharacterized membrane protein
MSIPGLLVEYLITGAIGLTWILFGFNLTETFTEHNYLGLILIPFAYTLGMTIDLLAYAITYFPKQLIRRKVEQRHYQNKAKIFDYKNRARVNIIIGLKYAKLNSEINMRSSRDRIARGMIVNALGVLIFLGDQIPLMLTLSMILVSALSWAIFEYVSHRFYLNAYDEVVKEIKD